MGKSKIILNEEERKQIRGYLTKKSHPWQVRKRLEVIRLADSGCSTAMIAKQLAMRPDLVRKYCLEFSKGGFAAIFRLEKPGKETLLTEEMFCALEAFEKAQKKQKKRCTLKVLSVFLVENYHISMSEEWLSKRLRLRKQAMLRQKTKLQVKSSSVKMREASK